MEHPYQVVLHVECSRAYDRGLLRGISSYSNEHGPWVFYRMQPFYLTKDGKPKLLVSSKLERQDISGLITRNPRESKALIDKGIPTVITHDIVDPPHGIPRVVPDAEAFGAIGAEYFIRRAFKTIAFCGLDDMHWSVTSAESFCRVGTQAGCKCYLYKQPSSQHERLWENEQLTIADWLGGLPKPLGLMCCNDDRAQQILEACKISGVRIPNEIAVLGLDNDEMICGLANPPLSSIVLNSQRVGYEVARILDKMMRGKQIREAELKVKPIRVVTRQSTDILAIEDEDIASAVRYIHSNAQKPITVDDVLDVVPVSRRYLEKGFRQILGRSIHDEIQRIRIDQVTQLLTDTDLSISQIAQVLGFPFDHHLSRPFRKEKGISPSEYRKLYSPY